MKRSEVNRYLQEAIEFCIAMKFCLPPFAFWSPEEWLAKGPEYDEIRDNMLGWDLTDFGSGDYTATGLLMFTLRNGNLKKSRYVKPYAEKLLIVREEQVTPFHFHTHKMEDIINRGGGNLLIEVYNATPDDQLAKTHVNVSMDGRSFTVSAGTVLKLTPGESISLPTRQYHRFWGEKGSGTILAGEVSKVNDDTTDNHFLEPVGRFPQIEADEKPRWLLCTEYPPAGLQKI